MKLSQSGAYIVDDTGHIVPARKIMAELERLKFLLMQAEQKIGTLNTHLTACEQGRDWKQGVVEVKR